MSTFEPHAPVLGTLLGGMSPGEFLTTYWGQRPFVGRKTASGWVGDGDWACIERLVAHTGCDMLLPKDGALPEVARPRTLDEALAHFRQGHSLVFRQPERHEVALAALGRSLARELFAALNLHVYCTPGGHGSFGWHFDPEDVFILQTTGAKRYELRENTQVPSPLPEHTRQRWSVEEETTPIETFELRAGDCLYIPRGTWHTTCALEDAISISVGLLAPSYIDVLDFLRAELVRLPEWRERLPVLGTAAPLPDLEKMGTAQAALRRLAGRADAILGNPVFTARFLAGFASFAGAKGAGE